jgi:hypothetical protein
MMKLKNKADMAVSKVRQCSATGAINGKRPGDDAPVIGRFQPPQ